MPFVKQERRDVNLYDMEKGDLCYRHYKKMVDRWRLEPRWATAHDIYYEIWFGINGEREQDELVALNLAWQVFFQLHVVPYELKQREKNGDV